MQQFGSIGNFQKKDFLRKSRYLLKISGALHIKSQKKKQKNGKEKNFAKKKRANRKKKKKGKKIGCEK